MGILIAISIILSWAAHLLYSMALAEINFLSPFFFLHILLMARKSLLVLMVPAAPS